MPSSLFDILQQFSTSPYPVIKISETDKILKLDLSENNLQLTAETVTDIRTFSKFIDQTLANAGCTYGIGGYDELRNLYARSEVFNGEEPRRLHLGVDIWGVAGTPVFAPLDGKIHSLAYNGSFGDYGATLILQHQLEGKIFHTLYGHLSLASIKGKVAGQAVVAGEEIAAFGPPAENGAWPPHLHFQVIEDMEGKEGDYPGVCRFSEREKYLSNCPDANLFLKNLHQQLVS
jgi:murein DD-endopeptidase MepM/ murein hydrolase activator NlpD